VEALNKQGWVPTVILCKRFSI